MELLRFRLKRNELWSIMRETLIRILGTSAGSKSEYYHRLCGAH